MTDRQFVTAGQWALASDGVQWVLQRRRQKNGDTNWRPACFVRSTRDILARCMREKGIPGSDAEWLLAGLPPTFDEWLEGSSRWSGALDAPPLVAAEVTSDQAQTSGGRRGE